MNLNKKKKVNNIKNVADRTKICDIQNVEFSHVSEAADQTPLQLYFVKKQLVLFNLAVCSSDVRNKSGK